MLLVHQSFCERSLCIEKRVGALVVRTHNVEEGFSWRMELGGAAARGEEVRFHILPRLSVQFTCGCNQLDRLQTDCASQRMQKRSKVSQDMESLECSYNFSRPNETIEIYIYIYISSK